jgi:hypothetical protein
MMKYSLLAILMGAIPFLVICATAVVTGQSTSSGTTKLPAIDLAAPAQTETATFALG